MLLYYTKTANAFSLYDTKVEKYLNDPKFCITSKQRLVPIWHQTGDVSVWQNSKFYMPWGTKTIRCLYDTKNNILCYDSKTEKCLCDTKMAIYLYETQIAYALTLIDKVIAKCLYDSNTAKFNMTPKQIVPLWHQHGDVSNYTKTANAFSLCDTKVAKSLYDTYTLGYSLTSKKLVPIWHQKERCV